MAEHADNLVAGDLDEVTAAEGLQERRCLVHHGAQVGRFDLPALAQLPDQEVMWQLIQSFGIMVDDASQSGNVDGYSSSSLR